MAISAGLIAKGATGAAAATAIAVGVTHRKEIAALFSRSETVNLSKWDVALIEKAKDSGIQFNSSPEVITWTFSEDNQTPTITLSVLISNSKLTELKSQNNNKEWGWECAIVFKREGSSNAEVKEDLKTSFKDFLEKIKSSEDENKELKVKFIEKCAGSRGNNANNALKTLNDLGSWPDDAKSSGQDDDVIQEDNKIKSEKEFTLVEESGTNKLKIKDDEKDEFDSWFAS